MALFVPLEASYTEDPKVQSVSERAELLFVRGLCYCKTHWQTEGFIHRRALYKIAPFTDEVMPQELAQELADAGLWIIEGDGWRIAAWLIHNPSVSEIDEKRRKETERKAEWRESRRNRDAGTDVPRDADATDTHPHPETHPHSSSSSTRDAVVDDALKMLARHDVDEFIALGGIIRKSRRSYENSCLNARRKDHASDLHAILHDFPTMTASELAACVLEDEKETAAASVTPIRPAEPCDECGWTPEHRYPHQNVHAEWLAG